MRLAITGINGKMGKVVYDRAIELDHNIIFGVDKNIISNVDCNVYKDFFEINEGVDAVIDFSSREILNSELSWCKQHTTPLVIATTNLNDNDLSYINEMAKFFPIIQSPNMCYGINLIKEVLIFIDKKIKKYDIFIDEIHHKTKKDSPSGTAIMLANCLSNVNEIQCIRGGNVVGEHTITLLGNDEKITINHTAYNKSIFANGAILCAEFLQDKKYGLFSYSNIFND